MMRVVFPTPGDPVIRRLSGMEELWFKILVLSSPVHDDRKCHDRHEHGQH
jgi:hypothetical protein